MSEAGIRLSIFVGILALMLVMEARMPHHHDPMRAERRVGNGLLFLIGLGLARLVLPAGALGVAMLAEARGWGVLAFVPLADPLKIGLCVVLLDLAIYGQHVLFHKMPWFWRLHRVHHADPHLDVTTGLRFHPLEIAISLGVKASLIVLLGAPVMAVLIFEIILNAGSMITHANWKWPSHLDRVVRGVFVTPAMHRIHHSEDDAETDSNYGFSFSLWDRLFGTYCHDARSGDDGIVMGTGQFGSKEEQAATRQLTQPFRNR